MITRGNYSQSERHFPADPTAEESSRKGWAMWKRTASVLGLLVPIVACGSSRAAQADDAPYVPTPDNVVEAMLAIAEVGPKDYVVDLGSGDGRIPIAAAKRRGARGLGIELNPELIARSRQNATREGVADRVMFRHEDIFLADFRDATVVTLYLFPEVNYALRPRILYELRPGTRVVSHDWDMADWEPDRQFTLPAPHKPAATKQESRVYLWIVPARVAGSWQGTLTGPDGEEPALIEFSQRFQHVTATVWLRRSHFLGMGRLRGEHLALALERPSPLPGRERIHLNLRVASGRMEGPATEGDQRYLLRAQRILD
jgi:SAM-dependent methyltransferase